MFRVVWCTNQPTIGQTLDLVPECQIVSSLPRFMSLTFGFMLNKNMRFVRNFPLIAARAGAHTCNVLDKFHDGKTDSLFILERTSLSWSRSLSLAYCTRFELLFYP